MLVDINKEGSSIEEILNLTKEDTSKLINNLADYVDSLFKRVEEADTDKVEIAKAEIFEHLSQNYSVKDLLIISSMFVTNKLQETIDIINFQSKIQNLNLDAPGPTDGIEESIPEGSTEEAT